MITKVSIVSNANAKAKTATPANPTHKVVIKTEEQVAADLINNPAVARPVVSPPPVVATPMKKVVK